MRGIVIVTAAAALLQIGCPARQQAFAPMERATALSPEGYTAAEYELNIREGRLGDAKVWSRGAYRTRVRGEERTVVHVGFELDNFADRPFRLDLDQLRLDSAQIDRRILRDLRPAHISGQTVVDVDGEARAHVYFLMPRGIMPTDVNAFRIRWQVRTDGLIYAQRTPFVEVRVEPIGYYHTPFFDPFYYDPYIFHPRLTIRRVPYRYHHVIP